MEPALDRMKKLVDRLTNTLDKFDDIYASTNRLAESIKRMEQKGMKLDSATEASLNYLQQRNRERERHAARVQGFDDKLISTYKAREKLLEIQKRSLDILTKRESELAQAVAAAGKKARPIRTELRQTRIQRALAQRAYDASRAAAEKEVQDQLHRNRFGVTPDEAREVWANFRRQLNGVNLILIAVGASFRYLADQAREVAHTFRQAGFSYTETFTAGRRAFSDFFANLRQGVFTSPADAARTRAAFARNIGTTNLGLGITREAERLVGRGIDPEAAAKVSYQVYRLSGFSAETAKFWNNTALAMAKANNIPIGQAFQELAQHVNLLANAANRVPGALERAVFNAKRLGVNIESIEGIANRLTGDFETYLDTQARLQTVIPGFDLTGVMIASQYGSTDDVTQALQAQLGGRDIGSLPRSIRQMISGALGISEAELVNMGKGAGPGMEIKDPTWEQIDQQNKIMASIKESSARILGVLSENVVGLLGKFSLGLAGLSIALGSLSKTGAVGGTLGTALGGGIFAKMGMSGLLRGMGAAGAGMTAALPWLAVGAGGLAASYLGTRYLLDKILPESWGYKIEPETPEQMAFAGTQPSTMAHADAMSVVSKDTSMAVVAKLEEVKQAINNMRLVINLDGRKVGSGVVEAYARG